MNNLWLNIRIWHWHIQAEYGELLPMVAKNEYFAQNPLLTRIEPVRIHEFSPLEGWRWYRPGSKNEP